MGQAELGTKELGESSEHIVGFSLNSQRQHGESGLGQLIISSEPGSPALKQKTKLPCLAWELQVHEPQIRSQCPDTQYSGITFLEIN